MRIIIALVRAYPTGASIRINGNLLVHYLESRSVLPTIEELDIVLAAYPAGVSVPSANGDLLLHYACSRESFDAERVRHVYRKFPNAVQVRNTKQESPLLILQQRSDRLRTEMSSSCMSSDNAKPLLAMMQVQREVLLTIPLKLRMDYESSRLRALHWESRRDAVVSSVLAVRRGSRHWQNRKERNLLARLRARCYDAWRVVVLFL